MADKQLKVLVVDDDAGIRSVLTNSLNKKGYTVSVARNGQEGLESALSEHPDLILLDLVMPMMDGMAMLKELRADPWGKTARVILLSNSADADKTADAMDNEVFDYLVKNHANPEDIVERVNVRLSPALRSLAVVLLLAAGVGLGWGGSTLIPLLQQQRENNILAVGVPGLERSGTLALSPADGEYAVGTNFVMHVYIDSIEVAVNASEATIRYPTERLRVTSVSKDDSIFWLWTEEPSYSNEKGTVRYGGGLPSPGYAGEFGKIISIGFEVVNEGISVVELESDALLLANDGFGTDILESRKPAVIISYIPDVVRGDLDGDGKVSIVDLGILLASLGQESGNNEADFNNDGKVDVQDVSILYYAWTAQ